MSVATNFKLEQSRQYLNKLVQETLSRHITALDTASVKPSTKTYLSPALTEHTTGFCLRIYFLNGTTFCKYAYPWAHLSLQRSLLMLSLPGLRKHPGSPPL
jgi:hypothetical protein